MELNSAYWTSRYQNKETGWDIGHPGPLARILDQLENKDLRILIPGCGSGYEAEYALQCGFTKTHLLDFSQKPLEAFKLRCPQFPEDQVHHADFFSHSGEYDVILEQTFFCALPPKWREKYVRKMHSLLAENGLLTGVLFNFPLDSGPPFGGSKEEYIQLFSRKFDIIKMEPCSFSIKPRSGKELHIKFRKHTNDRR